jgi:hypothetical protein
LLEISATAISEQMAREHEFECALIDHAAVLAADQLDDSVFQGCTLLPAYAIAIKPAEDMIIPIFVCAPHYISLKIGINEGVAVSEEMLNFPT